MGIELFTVICSVIVIFILTVMYFEDTQLERKQAKRLKERARKWQTRRITFNK